MENVKRKIASFLQTNDWLRFQKSLGREGKEINANGTSGIVIKKPLLFSYSYLYAPRGPLFTRCAAHEINSCIIWARESFPKSVFFRIEPEFENSKETRDVFSSMGFLRTKDLQPQKTRFLDLQKTDDVFLKEMDHNTRYSVRASERRGVTVQHFESKEEKLKHFGAFWKMFKETNARHNLSTYPKRYYEGLMNFNGDVKSALFLAYYKEEVIGGAIIFFFDDTATYLYAASKGGFEKLNAPSLVLWSAILFSRDRGFAIFDLWGISDTNPSWAGLTRFKRGFGGRDVEYIGTWDFPFKKAFYSAYCVGKKLL